MYYMETCVAKTETIMQLDDIKIKEFEILSELLELKSIRELARQRQMYPGQVSKIVSSLEQKLGVNLLERSVQGVTPSAKAFELAPIIGAFLRTKDELQNQLGQREEVSVVGFASTSFFTTHLVPALISDFTNVLPQSRFRLIDLPPDQFIPVGLRGGFQMCLHLDDIDWPKTWVSEQVGSLEWGVYCRNGHPLAKKPNEKEMSSFPWTYPVYWSKEGIKYGNDGYTLPITKRRRGTETTTATTALEIIKSTDELLHLPEILAKKSLQSGEIRKVPTKGRVFSKKVYLTVKADLIKNKEFGQMVGLIKKALAQE
jgi:DNA-binding transcriptional LysR family regulator